MPADRIELALAEIGVPEARHVTVRGLGTAAPKIQRLGEITHPTLILTHPGDTLHPLASGELLHERMPHAKLAVAPSQSYWRDEQGALEQEALGGR